MELHEVAARLQRLPAHQRVIGAMALKKLYGDQITSGYRAQDWASYADQPADYIERKLGGTLVPIVDGVRYDSLLRALELIVDEPFVLIPGGNGQGKDWLLGAIACWHHDAVAAQLGEDSRPMGSRTLILGPSENSVFQTTYASVLAHASRAEQLGYSMPPRRSTRTPRWMPREEHCMECITPAAATGSALSHRASGRHHRNLLAVLGEASGLRHEVVESIIGSASGGGPGRLPGGGWMRNGIVCIFNPDQRDSAVARLMRSSSWRVIHLSALDHVNVRTRRLIIPGAVSAHFVDSQIADCQRLGPYPETAPDPSRHDFVYALPPVLGQDGGGPRPDGQPGHVDGELAVYRASHLVAARVLGVLPAQDDSRLFRADAWDAGVARWRRSADPQRGPDAVGLDCAREGNDDSVAAPRWGHDAVSLLARWAELVAAKKTAEIEALVGSVRIGRMVTAPKGDGPTVASDIWRRWPSCPWMVDDGGIGASVYDAARQLGVAASPVSFGGAAPAPVEGQLFAGYTIRDTLYALAASLVNRGWVDIPEDPLLREEAMATWAVDYKQRRYVTQERQAAGYVRDVERYVSTRSLPKKEEISKLLDPRRSPDRLDAFVLSLWRPIKAKPAEVGSLYDVFSGILG